MQSVDHSWFRKKIFHLTLAKSYIIDGYKLTPRFIHFTVLELNNFAQLTTCSEMP